MQDGRDLVLSRTLKAIHKAIKDSGKPRNAFRGVGMGHSGVIDADKALGTTLSCPGQMVAWKQFPLMDLPEQRRTGALFDETGGATGFRFRTERWFASWSEPRL
jgi:hypothetical protein